MKAKTPRLRPWEPKWFAALVLAFALIALGAVIGQKGVALGAVSDTNTVMAVVSGALRLNVSITTPPSVYQSGVRMAGAIGASDIRAMVNQVPGQLDQYYTGARLSQLTSVVEAHAEEQSFPGADHQLPGVVQDINFHSVKVNGDSAIAMVSDLQWRNFIHFDANGKPGIFLSPHHHLTWTFTLVRTSGAWRITSDSFTFAPGEGP